MRRGRRGSSLLLVMGILVIFAFVLGILASVLLSDLRSTRRRANDHYAVELARSGVDFARGWLMEKGTVPSGTLKLRGGEIDVRVEELPSGGRRIVSVGRVVEGGAMLAARREIVVLGVPPPPAPAAPSAEDPRPEEAPPVSPGLSATPSA